MASADRDAPVIVLVPGAFSTPGCYDKLLPFLNDSGFPTHPGPYPSCNPPDPTTATCEKDIVALRDGVILPLLEQQKNVVIVAHSYGCVVAGAAAKDLDKATRRANGRDSGIIGLIFIAGIIALENEALLASMGGKHAPFIQMDKPAKGLALIEPAMDVLFNDCDSALESELTKDMYPHALLAFDTPAGAPAWADQAFAGKRAYIRTLNDNCNPSWVQDKWLDKSKVEWLMIELPTGHMPFVSEPKDVAIAIMRFILTFIGP
ncbi:Alpha/Beta hydrolase protein [Nemania sp. FL0916]|nr:Alpha/Beta hydrolase protein [Nemania sp. FL0916]